MTDHDTDFAAWAKAQADALRRRRIEELDWENLADEVEGFWLGDRHAIAGGLMRICAYLLTLTHCPNSDYRLRWRATVLDHRDRIQRIVEDSPSLRAYPAAKLAQEYRAGRHIAELYAPDLPDECPWTIEQVLDDDFWPDA